MLSPHFGEAPEVPRVSFSKRLSKLDKKFHRVNGWVGGDGAFSVSTSDKRTLWLFSDTWIGSIRDGKRRDVKMVNNTIGVQDSTEDDTNITFAIARGQNNEPGTLFIPPDRKGWFWIYAGHYANGKLHVFLPRQEKTEDPGAFGFCTVDMWLGSVSNSHDEPTRWQITYKKVLFADFAPERKRSFGSAVLTVGDYAYIYGYEEKPGWPFAPRRLLIARAPTDKLADLDSWRFLSHKGEWTSNVNDVASFADNLATEFSVTYFPALKQYVLVYTENGLSDRILGRFASLPTGPWSEPLLLYKCPEMKRQNGLLTYAAKAHPHLATRVNELVISYVANALEFATVMNDAELYWPRFVCVRLKIHQMCNVA